MPTDEELQAAVEKAKADALAEAEERIKAAANGKFTQEDLDRIAGSARTEGRTVAERELLKSLGVSDLDAAKSLLKAAKDAEDAQKTELEKAQAEVERLKTEAESARTEAHVSRATSALEIALRDAGINPERAEAAKRLVDLSTLKVEGTTVEGIDAAVAELKTTSPEWFGVKSVSPPNASDPGGSQLPDFRTASQDERDRALAAYGVRI